MSALTVMCVGLSGRGSLLLGCPDAWLRTRAQPKKRKGREQHSRTTLCVCSRIAAATATDLAFLQSSIVTISSNTTHGSATNHDLENRLGSTSRDFRIPILNHYTADKPGLVRP